MSLPHAILGFLRDRTLTGYDLKTLCFDDSVAHFWPADQAQIYRTLDKLAEEGFVESQVEVQADRPNRKLYAITQAGRDELTRWLSTPQALPVHREPFLIQLFFGSQLDPRKVIDLLRQKRDAHQSQLERFRAIEQHTFSTPNLSTERLLQRATLELGIRNEQMYIDWIDDCLQQLNRQ
jgi:PadR family transcriptional regulator, regulatory protein AphA